MARAWTIRREIDLERDFAGVERIAALATTSAKSAHQLRITVKSGGEPIGTDDASVLLNLIFPDGVSTTADGSIEDGACTAMLPTLCYQRGETRGVLLLQLGAQAAIPVYAFVLRCFEDLTDAFADPDHVIPSIAELLAQIDAMKSATADGRTQQEQVAQAEASRVNAEKVRATAEQNRAEAERNRASAETSRVNAEKARETAEQNRASAEQNRVLAESSRDNAEQARAAAEQSRSAAEKNRASAETSRENAEEARVSAEQSRATAEQSRVSAESSRANAEQARATAEQNRASAEQNRVSAEQERVTAEQGRASAEQGRVSAEKSRVSAEQARVSEHSTNQKASTDQTARAKAAADKLSEFEVQVESLPPSADPTAKVTQTSTKTTVALGIPTSNFAYATFYINPDTRQLVMRVPNGFSAIQFAIQDRRLVVRINGE